jgi:acetoin utilization deacetylase AcuC-like enzyme
MAAGQLIVYWHDDVLLHDAGSFFEVPGLEITESHPESPERLRNIRSFLARGPLGDAVSWRDGRHATDVELLRFHTAEYIDEIRRLSALGETVVVDGTFAVSGGTWRAATAAAGCAIAAMEAVMSDPGVAFALVRPPGHHAVASRGEGYCIFNNCGLAVVTALELGAERVAVVDWDAHHGNGVQSFFYARPDVLTISMHYHTGSIRIDRSGGDGLAGEIGEGPGVGSTINVDFPPGTGDLGYGEAMREIVGPALEAYRPDVIVGAMGQDASVAEGNGRQCLTMAGFHDIGARLADYAGRHANGRLVLVEEGGYSLTYAPMCAYATLAGAIGRPLELDDPASALPKDRWTHYRPALRDAQKALEACQRQWTTGTVKGPSSAA